MSTDDSVSEDVSSSGALSHCHASADGDGGKESETSLLSSEGTSASGLAVSEDRHTTSHTTGGTVESRPMDITPACNKIRSLCLSTDEAFEQGKSLPFINPSSLETLRALVQEIQSSGETDPEIWKDCEGRWLHLFQLVEKQYQEQILAQQEQYQCQIQLIQDEIKALVQLQNRQASVQPHTDFCPTPVIKTTTDSKDYMYPLLSKHVTSDTDSLAAPAHSPFSSPSPPLHRPDTTDQQGEERATTVLSSGYGTLSAWETVLEPAASPGEDEDGGEGREKHHWPSDFQDNTETTVIGCQQEVNKERAETPVHQQRSCGSQLFTSWAQRHKLRAKRSRGGAASSQQHKENLLQSCEQEEQQRAAGPSTSSVPLRRSDSLMSEASGLTYWRLAESELYRPLPDSFDSGAYLLLQEASMSLEPRLSLREIYQNKHRSDAKRSDWEGSITSSPSSPQVLMLDPAANQRQSDRTSGFTSPSHFSSPSFAAQPQLHHRVDTPVTPDSMAACSPNPADTDCVSDASSVSASPSKLQSMWGNSSKAVRSSNTSGQQHRASEEEEGSHTHSSTLKPGSAAGVKHTDRASSLDDPVVVSLLRQNLRDKHSRHVADLKAYYEAEIQTLKDKLQLTDLPQDLERSNQTLTLRCKQLEEALTEATNRVEELEAANSSLEQRLADWPERYAVAAAAVKSLQQRLEESKRSDREKDAAAARLKTHLRQLEEAMQKHCREADEKEARREREHKMLQELLGEYDSLLKEHEGLKKNFASTENKLFSANDQISELKRLVSKLESQVKQLEHENQARARHSSHSSTQPSGAGLFHHPDLLMSPAKRKAEPDVTRRKSPCPPSEQLNGGRKSAFLQTNQSDVHRKLSEPSSGGGGSEEAAAASWRCVSPPECEQLRHPEQSAVQWDTSHAARREASCALTPVMRALIELEETRATESRAPWVNQRTRVGFVDRTHKEVIQERAQKADRGVVKPGGGVARAERGGGGGGAKSLNGAEAAARLKAQRSLSPDGHRSSSLPPPAHRSVVASSPTKRQTLLMPLSAKSSPKRCPTENFSTAFGRLMPREEHLLNRFDGRVDQRRHSFHSSSPRKRLQFSDRPDDLPQQESTGSLKPPDGDSQRDWEELGACTGEDCEDAAPLLLDRLQSLSEAERLFDELTQEKLQIEAALSRMPAGGSRVSLQSRLDEVALEERLDRVNRQLGSIRMTLKRFHVLRSSANI